MRTKVIIFVGPSIEEIRAFPVEAKRETGFQLDKIQHGYPASDWKPINTIGIGVREIRVSGSSGIFRVVYVAKFKEAIYVLHAFQKKSQKTRKRDIEIAKMAYKKVLGKRNDG